jgi:hypothetical protein
METSSCIQLLGLCSYDLMLFICVAIWWHGPQVRILLLFLVLNSYLLLYPDLLTSACSEVSGRWLWGTGFWPVDIIAALCFWHMFRLGRTANIRAETETIKREQCSTPIPRSYQANTKNCHQHLIYSIETNIYDPKWFRFRADLTMWEGCLLSFRT